MQTASSDSWRTLLTPIPQDLSALAESTYGGHLSPASAKHLVTEGARVWNSRREVDAKFTLRLIRSGTPVYVTALAPQQLTEVARVDAQAAEGFWLAHVDRLVDEEADTGDMVPWLWKDKSTGDRVLLLDFAFC